MILTYAPSRQNLLDPICDPLAGGRAIHAIRQQLIVLSVVVANRGGDSGGQSPLVQIAAGFGI